MIMSPDRVAQCAQLAMLFELSSSPKPGNIDRCHDFSDIGFHHFLVSAVSAYPVFRKAAQGRGSAGSLILEAVAAWSDWDLHSNTHFGSLVLMIPLALAAGRSRNLETNVAEVMEESTVQDAVDFYRAFQLAGARVAEVGKFSLKDPKSAAELCRSKRTLRDLMRLSEGHDLIAREWSTNYERSFRLSGRLAELVARHGLNEGVVRGYLEALAEVPDSLVLAKFGQETARHVSIRAGEVLQDVAVIQMAAQMDRDLLLEDINPGSTADLIAASLFISLLRDLRF
ncbi:2-(5''-triphosphoribosyl)-3'-dephosphocoenzyme-A synthase [uncultured archaeon]|nr:2-(5''-triphosphoribosyl)-3'-dephosphocoenzyme-A synthase [uncultured archaeon]